LGEKAYPSKGPTIYYKGKDLVARVKDAHTPAIPILKRKALHPTRRGEKKKKEGKGTVEGENARKWVFGQRREARRSIMRVLESMGRRTMGIEFTSKRGRRVLK